MRDRVRQSELTRVVGYTLMWAADSRHLPHALTLHFVVCALPTLQARRGTAMLTSTLPASKCTGALPSSLAGRSCGGNCCRCVCVCWEECKTMCRLLPCLQPSPFGHSVACAGDSIAALIPLPACGYFITHTRTWPCMRPVRVRVSFWPALVSSPSQHDTTGAAPGRNQAQRVSCQRRTALGDAAG